MNDIKKFPLPGSTPLLNSISHTEKRALVRNWQEETELSSSGSEESVFHLIHNTPVAPSASALVSSVSNGNVGFQFDEGGNDLYPNDEINALKYDDIVWLQGQNRKSISGKLVLTLYRTAFFNDNDEELFSVPYGTIFRIEKMGGASTSNENSYGVEISCKDVRHICLASKKAGKVRRQLYEELCARAFWNSKKNGSLDLWPDYAIEYRNYICSVTGSTETILSGWSIYKKIAEFDRMQLPKESKTPWYIDRVTNEKYEFCDTYPNVIVIPSAFKLPNEDGIIAPRFVDAPLIRVRDFRSKGRIPVLSWYNKRNHATITRSSQPLTGLSNKVCEDDKRYLLAIAATNPNQAESLYIVDARPKVNALANMAKGGGYEDYNEHSLEFLNIQNIHVMRESHRKLQELLFPCVKDEKSFLAELDNTGWLWHIKQILSGAHKIAYYVSHANISVLVHCSDGWDRTSQLTSLAMLMLDGYYRTLEGFMVLIEKEWISFGHRFTMRIGHGEDKHSDSDRSPIFLQFIDAVYQFYSQINAAFEFNEIFLITVLDHLYSCQFGTFLYNSEKERMESKCMQNTVSLWYYILKNRQDYINPFYSPRSINEVLLPSVSIRHMKLWTNYYARHCYYTSSTLPYQSVRWKQLQVIKTKLRANIEKLRMEIEQMKDLEYVQDKLKKENFDDLAKASELNDANAPATRADHVSSPDKQNIMWRASFEKTNNNNTKSFDSSERLSTEENSNLISSL